MESYIWYCGLETPKQKNPRAEQNDHKDGEEMVDDSDELINAIKKTIIDGTEALAKYLDIKENYDADGYLLVPQGTYEMYAPLNIWNCKVFGTTSDVKIKVSQTDNYPGLTVTIKGRDNE